MLLQAGSCCYESGLVRAKNSIHAAIKNIVDFCLASALFWMVGFGLMFGPTYAGVVGTDYFVFGGENGSPWLFAFFLFQLAFCGFVTRIISGAVAERIYFGGYVVVAAVALLLIYPVAGHWVWGGMIPESRPGWLAALGFVDFAGATVLHSVGGWLALAMAIIIGPRTGRFSSKQAVAFDGHNIPQAGLGVVLLWVGWSGLTGGAGLAFTADVPLVLLNTALGGAFGGLVSVTVSSYLSGRANVYAAMTGVLAGLVAVSAGGYFFMPYEAALVGGASGALCVFGRILLVKLRIDDAVGVIPVHLFGGIWGTMAVGLLAEPGDLVTGLSRSQQIGVQALGVVCVGAYAFILGGGLLYLLNKLRPMRVDADYERVGLNAAEHGASTVLFKLLQQMEWQRQQVDFSRPVDVEPETEAGQVAMQYNLVLEKFNAETQTREQAVRAMGEAKDSAEMAYQTKSRFFANVSHELRTPLNAIIGFSEAIRSQIFGPVGNNRYMEYAEDIHASGKHLLSLINDILDISKIEAQKFDIVDEDVLLDEVVASSVRLVSTSAQDKNIHLVTELAQGLPMLRGDGRAMTQIMLNLLSNAIKFTPEGGQVRVRTWLRHDNGLSISVDDTGVGIPESDIAKVMEPFIQSDSDVSTNQRGTGLGLPLTKSLVELHAGTIQLQSQVGTGTCATIDLPPERTLLT